MGEAEEGAVGDLGELGAEGSIDRRLPMAVDVDPEGGDAVEVAPPVCIDEDAPLAALDDRVALPQPVLHLGERVPDVSFVVLPEPMAAGGHFRGQEAAAMRSSGEACPELRRRACAES